MRAGEGKAFLGLLSYAMSGEGLLGTGGLMGQQLETMLMVGLLQTQRHNLTEQTAEAGAPLPRAVRSPMTVLRDLRLERAWQELSHPGPLTSVTDVAMQLGFFHLGRFSEHYRRKFGCTLSETLRGAGRL